MVSKGITMSALVAGTVRIAVHFGCGGRYV
jgi:hypothetical protein